MLWLFKKPHTFIHHARSDSLAAGKITSGFLLSSSLSYRCGFTVQSASKTAIIHSENKVGGYQFGCKDGKDCQNGQLVIQQPVKQLLASISLYRSLFLAMVLYKKYINRCEFACKSWSITITVLCNKYSTFIYKKRLTMNVCALEGYSYLACAFVDIFRTAYNFLILVYVCMYMSVK